MVDSRPADAGPLVWRVPAWQAATMFLITCGSAALNLYGHPTRHAAVYTIVFGLAAFAFGLAGLRMYLIVQSDGVAVRYLWRETWLPWAQIAGLEIVHVRGSATIRLARPDGSFVNVPPSVLQPTRLASKRAAWHLLKDILRQIEERRPAR